MTLYLLSLVAGLFVGVIYSLLHVQSPAPPLFALIGLLGMLVGERLIPMGRQMLMGCAISVAWEQSHFSKHMVYRQIRLQGDRIPSDLENHTNDNG